MLRVYANDPHHAFAVDHLAFGTYFLHRRSYFHSFLVILPRVRSWGVSTTSTRSPGNSRTKFLAFSPLGCASTRSLFSSSTRYTPFGISSTTLAATAWSAPTARSPSLPRSV